MYLVGYILKPQGIKGELKVQSVSPDPERFKSLKKIFIERETPETYLVESVRISDRFVFLKLKGIDSRSNAEILRGAEILIRDEDVIELKHDEYFVHDLIGCRVVDEQNNMIGKLTGIMQNTSNDIYVLIAPDGREVLIPAIREVVREIKLKNKQITIRVLDGLLD